jgi:tRNA nucleotidyltransferase (CCA-adding enzyme)
VSIKPTNFGQVIDFFGGARDIKERSIRVLHNFAFVEDPTRILRAIRFCSRFGFQLGKHTLSLMKAAIKMKIFDKVEGKRLLNEFIYILNERNPLTSLTIMAAHGIPQAIHPALGITEKTKESVEAVSGVLSWWKYQAFKETIRPWLVYFQALTDSVSDDEFKSVLERFSVSQTVIQSFSIYRSEINNSLAFVAREHKRPSEISLFLKKMPIETLLFMMAKTPREQSRMIISEYLNKWRFVRPSLSGKDLIQSGYVPGPIFNDILHAITNAKLDGEIFGAEQEIEYTRKHFPISLN